MTAARRTEGEPCGPGIFEVPSASTPDLVWLVFWQNAAVHWCPCPRFAGKGACRHTDEVRALLLSEDEQRRAADTSADRDERQRRMNEIQELFSR